MMKKPPQKLISSITKASWDKFLSCFMENKGGEETITSVAAVISSELDKANWPCTSEEARQLAVILGLRFVKSMEEAEMSEQEAVNDEDPLH